MFPCGLRTLAPRPVCSGPTGEVRGWVTYSGAQTSPRRPKHPCGRSDALFFTVPAPLKQSCTLIEAEREASGLFCRGLKAGEATFYCRAAWKGCKSDTFRTMFSHTCPCEGGPGWSRGEGDGGKNPDPSGAPLPLPTLGLGFASPVNIRSSYGARPSASECGWRGHGEHQRRSQECGNCRHTGACVSSGPGALHAGRKSQLGSSGRP